MLGGSSQDSEEDAGLPKPGDLFGGRFLIERLVGRGGMGAVFAAQHEMLGTRVAIKILLSEVALNKEAVARFLNEARAASRIEGEHVARVMDVATLDDGRPYMVIEYLEGSDFGQLLEARGPLPVVEAVDCLLQALEALAQAHALGIVHRDFKPSNLFLARRSDGTTLVKVLDFGIAKATQPLTANAHVTQSNAVLGSPQYMAPEQLRNARNVDARTDIWAAGLTLYELLTGNVPFAGETFGELFAAIIEKTAVPLRQKRPDIDPDLEAIVARCLLREASQRFQTVTELAQALVRHGSARAAFSVERIISVLPPPMAGAGATPPAGPHVVRVGGGIVEPGAVTSIAPPSAAEGTAPPFSSSRSQSTDGGRSPRTRLVAVAIVAAGIGVLAVSVLRVGRSGPGDASNAREPASSVVTPLPSLAVPASASALAASSAEPEPRAPVVLAPLGLSPDAGPTVEATRPAPPSAGPRPAASPAGPSTAKSRVDQTGLAGENPFR